VPLRSSREAYPRRVREVELAHPLGTESEKLLARRGRIPDEGGDVDRLARWRERAQPVDAFFEKNGRAVKIAAAPVVKADTDLEDAVIEAADRSGRVAPQELERLVLLEEVARVELLDAAEERFGWRVGAAGPSRLVRGAGRLPLGRAGRFARAATGLGRARVR
jgi:hypothetical protein